MYQDIKERVFQANLELVKHGLVVSTFGNVSEIDRKRGIVAIKPSGVSYGQMTPDQMVILDVDGHLIDGELRPSSDTRTHLELYRHFKNVHGITHTHSRHATQWAQACKRFPVLAQPMLTTSMAQSRSHPC
jgi:L-ribulose-5-phosphate 4-epimerase